MIWGRFTALSLALALCFLPLASCSEPQADAVRLSDHIYDDEQLDRFWKDARRVLGDRLGYISEGDVDDDKQVISVGAVEMSEGDRIKLDDAAPHWVEVDAFETKYSIRDLRAFGKQAMQALKTAALGEFFTGLEVDLDVVYIMSAEDLPVIRETIESVIPADAYRIEISEGGSI